MYTAASIFLVTDMQLYIHKIYAMSVLVNER